MVGQKLTLQQRMLLKLSPQQIQMIKLLELPTLQLEQRIQREIEENPVLEIESNTESIEEKREEEAKKEENDFTVDDYLDDEPEYKYSASNYSKDDKQVEIPFSIGTTFHEYLIEQLGLLQLNNEQKIVAEYIIGNIDEDGYLRREIPSIVDDLAFSQGIETTDAKMLELLKVIQELDPPGVGARDLRENLMIQLQRKNQKNPDIRLALEIVDRFFDEISKHHYDKILTRLDINEEKLKDAIDEIIRLNPKPGSAFSNPLIKSNQTIVPDFILENTDNILTVSLNRGNIPDLKISSEYASMLRAYSENKKNQSQDQKDAVLFVKQKLDSAKWFIEAIRQRQHTLLITMNAIIEYQREYFTEGDEAKLKPMILKDIADRTGLDISTISRVSNSKYIQTNFGIFALKYFFSESMQDDAGEEVSTRILKNTLKDIIENEDKRNPITDDKLAEIITKGGNPIARRTVAKYREQLEIPVARLRKEL